MSLTEGPTLERSGAQRLCVIHRNVPAVLANITTQLGDDGVNVENMTNKSRGEYAYTVVDVGSAVDGKVIEDIRKVPGVIRMRVIRKTERPLPAGGGAFFVCR